MYVNTCLYYLSFVVEILDATCLLPSHERQSNNGVLSPRDVQYKLLQLPHYGIEMHLEVWDKDGDTPNDLIGSVVVTLGEKNAVGFAIHILDSQCKFHP